MKPVSIIQKFVFAWSLWLTLVVFLPSLFIWPGLLDNLDEMRHVEYGGLTIMINGWHALFHLGTGILALIFSIRRGPATVFAVAAGSIYLAIGVLSFSGSRLLAPVGMPPHDVVGNTLHVVEGFMVLAAGLMANRSLRAAAR